MELVCTNNAVARENVFFWNMVLCNVLGLANKHRTHEGAKTFNGFQGLTYTWIFDTIKRKIAKIKSFFKFLLKPCRNLMFLGPTKGGTPQTNLFEIRCVCVRNIFSLANKHRTPQKHFSYFRRDFLSTLGFRTSGHGDVITYYAWGLWWNIAIVNF